MTPGPRRIEWRASERRIDPPSITPSSRRVEEGVGGGTTRARQPLPPQASLHVSLPFNTHIVKRQTEEEREDVYRRRGAAGR